jgi:hypothetical protein
MEVAGASAEYLWQLIDIIARKLRRCCQTVGCVLGARSHSTRLPLPSQARLAQITDAREFEFWKTLDAAGKNLAQNGGHIQVAVPSNG